MANLRCGAFLTSILRKMKLKHLVLATFISFAAVSCADQNELVAPAPIQPLEARNTGGGSGSTEDTGMGNNPTGSNDSTTTSPVPVNGGL